MQAIDKRLGGVVQLLKPTEKNISYAFEGISSGLDVSCKNIAKSLKEKGILVLNPIGNNEYAYGSAVLAGDQAKIEEYKKSIASKCTTSTLIDDENLGSVLNLTPALKLRFADNNGNLITVTYSDFTRKMNELKNTPLPYKFKSVIAFAKDEEEAKSFTDLIKETMKNDDYSEITVISALLSPLSEDLFKQYVEYEAMSKYYMGNNNTSATENHNRAKMIIQQNWRNVIYQGTFVIYSKLCKEGERYSGATSVCQALQTIVRNKYPHCFDFNRGVSENALKPSQPKASAKCGIIRTTSGAVVNQERAVLNEVWNIDQYWINESTKNLSVSIIKKDLENLIQNSFSQEGQISMSRIVNHLENNYGFVCSNIYSFILGFLLKDYSDNPYRFADSVGSHENMTADKPAEMIANELQRKANDTYIVRMTQEEKAFYELTSKAWSIDIEHCVSVKQTMLDVQMKMREFGLPVWCLEDVCDSITYDIIKKIH
jgi:hypothetical protein